VDLAGSALNPACSAPGLGCDPLILHLQTSWLCPNHLSASAAAVGKDTTLDRNSTMFYFSKIIKCLLGVNETQLNSGIVFIAKIINAIFFEIVNLERM